MKSGVVGSFPITRPVAILMVFLAAVVFGFLSLGRLPVQLMPELTYPTLTVRTEYPGAAPEEVENDIGRPIEEELGVVSGLRKISSINRAGVSDVVLEFAWDTEIPDATQDVLEKLDRVFLPDDADRPLILHFDPSLEPIMELSLSGKGERYEGETGLRRLRRLGELQLKRDLEPIKGVAAVRIRGGLEEEIHVQLQAAALQRTGISIQQVIDRLAQENINVAGGTLQEGRTEYLVRTLNEYDDISQIGETIIASFEGRPVRIRDLGHIEYSHKEREILTRTDGGDSVQIDIYKEADANIVNVAKRVKDLIGDFDPETAEEAGAVVAAGAARPAIGSGGLGRKLFENEGARLAVVADRSLFIESSIDEVRNTAILGGILAIFILYVFLRKITSTFIIAISIPFSILMTFAPLNVLDVSLNIMSLGGLALGIGMLVDSSIVVLESIFRCREEGDGLLAAADRGTSEVRSAVFASTLTSIAVFFPMIFVEGLAGQAFGDLGFAVVFSLLASLAVALFFIPMLASRKWLVGDSQERTGPYYSYFRGDSWIRLRDRFRTAGSLTKALTWPIVGVAFLAGFQTHYVKLAWSEFRDGMRAAPRWFRLLNAHNWLIQLLLLLPLPFVVRGLTAIERGHVAIVARIWAEFREDWRNTSVLLRIVSSPFWLVRSLLSLPLPHLMLPWPWIYMFVSGSWTITRADFQGLSRRTKLLIGIPLVGLLYFALRVVLGSILEGVGKLLMWTFKGAVVFVIARIVFPIGFVTIQLLTYIPAKLTDLMLGVLRRAYPVALRSALAHPALVVVVVGACLWVTWQTAASLDSELLPEVHQGEFTVEVALPVGTPLQETEAIVAPIENAILEHSSRIESLIMTAGYDASNTQRSDEGEHTARFKVLLDEESRGAEIEAEVVAELRREFEGIPDLEARVVRPVLFSSKTPIEVEIQGQDLVQLRRHGDLIQSIMASISELTDVETTMRTGAPEVQIIYDRDRLARYDLSIGDVARRVRDKVKGFEATRYNLKDRRIPILVRLEMDDRETVEDIGNIIVNPGGERPIPLSAVATISLGEGPSEVRRISGTRVAVVRANLGDGSLSAAAAEIERRLASDVDWPVGMSYLISGQNEEWERSQSSLWIALGLSVFLVYVIMAAQFESLTNPLIIMITIPLAFFGTFVTLKLMNLNLSIVVFLGMIMLAGIVVNNAIVLVDYINTLRSREMERDEAIITAGMVRLRPILMTTATTVLGLAPLALGVGDGAELRSPMAIAVISGLISSTALTLIVIPTFYALTDSLVSFVVGSKGRVARATPAALDNSNADSVVP